MKKRGIAVVILLTFILISEVKALNISGGVWLVSETVISNDVVRMKLQDIESLVRAHEENMAISSIGALRSQITSSVKLSDNEYLPLILDAMELYYTIKIQPNNDNIPKNARSLLDKYNDKAKGCGYSAYKQIYQMMRQHFKSKKRIKEAIEIQKEAAMYDPKDYVSILPLVTFAKENTRECGELDTFIQKYKEAGGIIYEELQLAAIITSNESAIKKMNRACDWLDENALSSEKILTKALPLITKIASAKEPQTLIDYYYALTDLALHQPTSEDRLTVFAMAINERQKLITAAPELLPPR